MNRSDTINEIAAALAKAQGEIKGAIKARENAFYKSSYADLPAVMDACRKQLSENGIAVTQTTDFAAEEIWIETTLIHKSGQWISGRYPVRPVKHDPQGLGSAITYARRYALMGMVGIVAESDDDDGNAASGHEAAPPRPASAKKTAEKEGQVTQANAAAAAAEAFGKKVLTTLKAFRTMEEYQLWDTAETQDKIARLKQYNPELHQQVVDLLKATDERLS